MDGACLSGWKWVVGICGLDMLKLRVGAGRFDSSAWDTAARDSRVASSHTTLVSGDRRRRSSPPRRPIPPSSTTASDPGTLLHTLHRLLPRPFPHQLNPFIFLLDLRRIEQAARAAAAAAAPSRRPEFSSAVPAGHPHLRPPLPSAPPL